MLEKIYIAGVVATSLMLVFRISETEPSSLKEKTSNVFVSVACIAACPIFLAWIVFDCISLLRMEIDDGDSDG